jgi:hypothetical protein
MWNYNTWSYIGAPLYIQIKEFTVADLKPGKYRHYKGQDYEVFNIVRHSENEEQLVVYRCLYGDFSWWVRPLAMFMETVIIDGETIPRFNYVGPMGASEAWENTSVVA